MTRSDPTLVEMGRSVRALVRPDERDRARASASTPTASDADNAPNTVKRPRRLPAKSESPHDGDGGAESVPLALVPPFDASGPDRAPASPTEWAAEYGHIPSFGVLDAVGTFDADLTGDE